jgi:hypothetical protein
VLEFRRAAVEAAPRRNQPRGPIRRASGKSLGARIHAPDADSRVFCYSNADIRKGDEAEEVFRFTAFWKRLRGSAPKHLVFDSKLTTYEGLDRLDAAGITFLTLRRRAPKLLAEIDNLPPSAWRTITLDIVLGQESENAGLAAAALGRHHRNLEVVGVRTVYAVSRLTPIGTVCDLQAANSQLSNSCYEVPGR